MKHAKAIAFVVIAIFAAAWFGRFRVRLVYEDWQRRNLPAEQTPRVTPSGFIAKPTLVVPTPTPWGTPQPFEGVNLSVPFQAQAPRGDWSLPWQETCEEASAVLVDAYWKRDTLSVDEMERRLLAAVAWEQTTFGYYEHTTAAQTALMLRQFYGYSRVDVKYDATVADIRANLEAGRPVIVPLAGRLVGNEFYRTPGPIYHMLVVKGMTKDGRIITDDVGTRHGYDYLYDADVFVRAMHDVPAGGAAWPPGVDPAAYIQTGRAAIIVVHPN